MTDQWTFQYRCSDCGGVTRPEALGSPSAWHTTAVTICETCGTRWQLTVLVERLSVPTPLSAALPCGTDRAYRRHYERGEKPCEACRAAHAATRRGRRHE